jgi:hypothetical protein
MHERGQALGGVRHGNREHEHKTDQCARAEAEQAHRDAGRKHHRGEREDDHERGTEIGLGDDQRGGRAGDDQQSLEHDTQAIGARPPG